MKVVWLSVLVLIASSQAFSMKGNVDIPQEFAKYRSPDRWNDICRITKTTPIKKIIREIYSLVSDLVYEDIELENSNVLVVLSLEDLKGAYEDEPLQGETLVDLFCYKKDIKKLCFLDIKEIGKQSQSKDKFDYLFVLQSHLQENLAANKLYDLLNENGTAIIIAKEKDVCATRGIYDKLIKAGFNSIKYNSESDSDNEDCLEEGGADSYLYIQVKK